MATINWTTQIITIELTDLTLISGGGGAGSLYELDVNEFRLNLRDLEDDVEGMPYPRTHIHNTEVTLSGVTYARFVEIINGYTVTFEELPGGAHYTVRCVGANHNLADVLNFNSVNLIIGNSAGLQTVAIGSGLSSEQAAMLDEIYQRLGLKAGKPLANSSTQISTPDFTLSISEAGGVVTVTRV